MIIINADDWGRSQAETNAALACHARKRLNTVSAMVFMADSERAAELAKEHGVDVGLHINFSQSHTGRVCSAAIIRAHERIVRFVSASKYAMLFYNPSLKKEFREVFQAQLDEFVRIYNKMPRHIDGHQHKHLCANMLFDEIVPRGNRVRRSFSFSPGEKSWVNRAYRQQVDKWLGQRYFLTDYFFSLGQCLLTQRLARVLELSKNSNVELMTHPIKAEEYAYLMKGYC